METNVLTKPCLVDPSTQLASTHPPSHNSLPHTHRHTLTFTAPAAPAFSALGAKPEPAPVLASAAKSVSFGAPLLASGMVGSYASLLVTVIFS